MTAESRGDSDTPPACSQVERWTVHPARARPGAAAMTGAAVLAIMAAVWLATFSWIWAGFATIVLVGALNRFYFPSRFTIDEEGLTGRYPLRTQRLSWNAVRRFLVDQSGGYLSDRDEPSRFDAYRGLHLIFPADDEEREAIIRTIRERIKEAEGAAAEEERQTV